jgi:topoisomerase-4 subunit A
MDKNNEEIALLAESKQEVEKNLKNVKKFTIQYLQGLIEKFGKDFARKTRIKAIEEFDRRAIETKEIKVGFDPESGFAGTKISGSIQFHCTNFDKLLVFHKDGTYKVVNIPEKQYFEGAVWVGVADKKTVMNVIYKMKETGQAWAKRFIVEKFILDKAYSYFDGNAELLHISAKLNESVELQFPSGKQKVKNLVYSLNETPVKGAHTRGVRIATQKVKKVITSEE